MTAERPTYLADSASIQRTISALARRNVHAEVVTSGEAAKHRFIEMIPEGSQIFNSTSETLDHIGYSNYVRGNPRYTNLHDALEQASDPAAQQNIRRDSSIAEYFIGSVQAIAETGEIVIASASGSQISAYAFGAKNVILVAGTQKICADLADAIERVRGYTVDRHDQWLEERGVSASPIGKLMIMEYETAPERVNLILIQEELGW